ncbi:hypothetical protein C2S51_038385 [Perilla frutescens var. frutescens]|nr:hypothetical protein C2S51_038385 [Perilla frutescens var. frutescens]
MDDCNGCVQKINKALHGITGIYDLYIDFPQQMITIIGWAEPEKIVKAIKKIRKRAIICSHSEQPDQQAQETEPVPEGGTTEGGAAPPESTNPQAEQPPKESPPPPDNPPAPEPTNETSQSSQPSKPEEIHVIYHHPPDYVYRYACGQWNTNPIGPGFREEPPQPVHVTHSYNMYKPSPYICN